VYQIADNYYTNVIYYYKSVRIGISKLAIEVVGKAAILRFLCRYKTKWCGRCLQRGSFKFINIAKQKLAETVSAGGHNTRLIILPLL